MLYTGVQCPVCGKAFGENDDIVVCPDCGAPYHRACYAQKGACVFPDLHREGRAWQLPAGAQKDRLPASFTEENGQKCPRCGTVNERGAMFCDGCGALLPEDGEDWDDLPEEDEPGRGFGGFVPPVAFDPMGGVNPTESAAPNISFGDLSKLVRANTGYYMPAFRFLKQTGRNKFNFAAFLFSGAWMLYRKQYKHGIFVTVLMLCLHLAYQFIYALVSFPAMQRLAEQAGIDLTQTVYLTAEQYNSLVVQMSLDPASVWQISLIMLVPLLMLIVMIVVGVRGNRMYFNHCMETLAEIRGQGEDVSLMLEKKGGVNSTAALCVAAAYLIIRSVLPILLL